MRRIVALAIALSAVASSSACGSSSRPPSTPKTALASIVAAALAQTSVHWTEEGDGLAGRGTSTADVTASSGAETIDHLHGRRGSVRIRLVDDTVYVNGDSDGLAVLLGITPAHAKANAGEWISIPKDDKHYARLADGLTLASVIHTNLPTGKLKLVGTAPHATRIVGIGGTSWMTSSLTARATGAPLPIAFSHSASMVGSHGSFSKWNEPVHVEAPATSTPIAIVHGSPQGVLASIVAATLAQKSIHLESTAVSGPYGTTKYVVDLSGDSVSERVDYGGSKLHLVVVNDAAYVRGDPLLLEQRLGLTQEQAMKYAGKWIWIPGTGDTRGLYAELIHGLSLASIIRRATSMKNLELSRRTEHGMPLVVVRGTPTSPSVHVTELQARANGTPLPVAFSGSLPGAATSGRFSRWNEPVAIRFPSSSTPIAVVRR
ncbi:MAG TPA: hypothetical protein VGH79_02000 [Gaiellaceae bacterium]|jgi:hypothetical protein